MSVHDATAIPERTMTVACHIGKHVLCTGEGTHVETNKTVACECGCHKKETE